MYIIIYIIFIYIYLYYLYTYFNIYKILYTFIHCWALLIIVNQNVSHTLQVGGFVKPGPTSCYWFRCNHAGEGCTAIGCAHPVYFRSERQMVGCEGVFERCPSTIPAVSTSGWYIAEIYVMLCSRATPKRRMLSKTNIQSQSDLGMEDLVACGIHPQPCQAWKVR